MRTAANFVEDMLKGKRTVFQILAVARVVRKGAWYDEVYEILTTKKLLSNEMIEKERAEITKKLRASWGAQRKAFFIREKQDKEARERREAQKREKEKARESATIE